MELPWKLPLVIGGRAKAVSLETYLREPQRLTEEMRRVAAAGCGILRVPTADAEAAACAALVAAAKQGADGRPLAGCLGSLGLSVEPYGDAPMTALVEAYAERVKTLREAGCDLLLCEGLTGLNEARAVLLAAADCRLPVIVTLRVDAQGETATGARLLPAVITLQALGAAAVGIEADAPVEDMAEWIGEALDYAAVPLAAVSASVREETATAYVDRIHSLLDAGAALVGGADAPDEAVALLCRLALEHAIVAAPEIDTDAAAGEREAFFLGEDLNCGEPLVCDSDLEDAFIEAEERYNAVRVALTEVGDIPRLLEAAQVCRLPIVIVTDRASVLDEVLLRYPGRLLVDSLGGVERALLEDIAAHYGAVVFYPTRGCRGIIPDAHLGDFFEKKPPKTPKNF